MTWVFSLVTTCRGPTAPSVSGGIAVKLSASPWNPLKFGIAVAAADGAISGCRAGVADGFAEFRRRTARSGSWLSRCNPSLATARFFGRRASSSRLADARAAAT